MAIYSDISVKLPNSSPLVEDISSVIQSVFCLFATEKLERVFRPEIGVDLDDFLYEPVDEITAIAILDEITRKITVFEPRVEVDTGRSSVIPHEDDMTFDVQLIVRVKALGEYYFPVGAILSK